MPLLPANRIYWAATPRLTPNSQAIRLSAGAGERKLIIANTLAAFNRFALCRAPNSWEKHVDYSTNLSKAVLLQTPLGGAPWAPGDRKSRSWPSGSPYIGEFDEYRIELSEPLYQFYEVRKRVEGRDVGNGVVKEETIRSVVPNLTN